MDDLTQDSPDRKELLKHMILQLHKGEAPEEVRKRLVALLKRIPYNEVVQVEQELINEGLPENATGPSLEGMSDYATPPRVLPLLNKLSVILKAVNMTKPRSGSR